MSKVIYVKTSDTCNLHCDHCFTSGRNGSKTQWDVNSTIQWIDEYRQSFDPNTPLMLIYHGGEPLLAPVEDLNRFMDHYVDDPLVTFTITTNLVYKLTEDKLNFLKRIGHVGTSWDLNTRFATPNQKKRWFDNMDALHSEGLSTCVFVAIDKTLVEYPIDAFLDEMQQSGTSRVRLERLTVDGNAERNPDIFPDNEIQDLWFLKVYRRYKERQAELSFTIPTLDLIETKVQQQIVKVDTNCRNCEQNLVTMNSDGSLAGCPNTAATHLHAHQADGVDAFLDSPGRVTDIVHELDFHPNCLKCDVFDLCGGDCHKLPWQGDRCGGLKHLLRHVSGRDAQPKERIPLLQLN